MSLDTEQLEELEKLGEIQFNIEECAIVLQCSVDILQGDAEQKAY